MKTKAIALGEQFVQLERQLNNAFSNKTMTQALLEKNINTIESIWAQLRIVHLSTHLQMPTILTNEQIALYNQLRGYSNDPCKHIPKGHNAEMWKNHNECE